jgi:hypothetical protein
VNVARWAVVVFIAIHGVGHAIWFVGAWIPRLSLMNDRPWILSGDVRISSPTGRLLSLLALVALVGFVGVAWGLAMGEAWWTERVIASAVVSLVAVVPWWRSSPGSTALAATVADVALIVLALLPFADKLTQAG